MHQFNRIQDVSRRTLLKGGGAALAGLSLQAAGRRTPCHMTTEQEQHEKTGGTMTSLTRRNHWDSPAMWSSRGSTSPRRSPFPDVAGSQLVWEELDSWLTPPEKFHFVTHYGIPSGLDELAAMAREGCRPGRASPVAVAGRPQGSPRAARSTSRWSVPGNHGTGLPFATGFIGNARWAGTPLAPVLEEARSPARTPSRWCSMGSIAER